MRGISSLVFLAWRDWLNLVLLRMLGVDLACRQVLPEWSALLDGGSETLTEISLYWVEHVFERSADSRQSRRSATTVDLRWFRHP